MKTIHVGDTPEPVALLRRLLVEMVSHPENLLVESRLLSASMTITLQAHAADTARLIGEGAMTYRAINIIMRAVGAQLGTRISIPPVREPVVGEPERYKFTANPDWPKDRILELLADTVRACFCFPDAISIAPDHDDDNITTTAEITVSRSEPAELVDALQKSLTRVFDAIGRNHGRLFAIDILATADAAAPQPVSARGRYTGEIDR